MRLIDADALMELYDMGKELEEYAEVLSVPIPVIRQNIKDMPTIDAVPVVRCGECERRDKCSDLTDTVYCLWYMEQMYKTDFCSYGTREEGSR